LTTPDQISTVKFSWSCGLNYITTRNQKNTLH